MPTYPPGFSTATVTVGEVVDFFGSDPATLTVEVTPYLGERATHIVHNATGVALAATTRVFDSDTGTVSFPLPHTDMPGWVDESGRTVSRWKYVVRVTAKPLDPRVSAISWKKEISPVIGQNLIDLELVPSAVTAEQFTLPPAPVTTVNGQTGAVVIPAGPPGPQGATGPTGPTGPAGQPTAFELRGTGFPNGVITAPPGTYYTDTAVTCGAIRWVKKTGTGNIGWEVLHGDTGWRNVFAGSWLTAWDNSAAGLTLTAIRVRRVNNRVYYRMAYNKTAGGSISAQNPIPDGFKLAAAYSGYATVGHDSGPNMSRIWIGGPTANVLFQGAAVAGAISALPEYFTDDAWPGILPGYAL